MFIDIDIVDKKVCFYSLKLFSNIITGIAFE